MILAIVGSTNVTARQAHTASLIIHGLILSYDRGYESVRVISGGAAGIDMIAQSVAENEGCFLQAVLPKNPRWEPEGYKDRNIVIAHMCDVLWSLRTEQSTTYGSGWTADYAEKIGKEVERIKLV